MWCNLQVATNMIDNNKGQRDIADCEPRAGGAQAREGGSAATLTRNRGVWFA